MTVAVCLLLYSLAVVVLGPRPLVRCTRAGIAPRLGVAVWLVAIGSVVLSWAAAAVLLAVDLARRWDRPGQILSDCVTILRAMALGGAGVAVQIGLLALAAAAVLALGVLAFRLFRFVVRMLSRTAEHGRLARLVGRQAPELGAVVLAASERAAYCVAGRPHTVVLTSGAVDALDSRQLAAVLSHERGHLAGRHHLLMSLTRGLAQILPRVRLFTTGAAEIARLLEMCADDTAARAHGHGTVLGALAAMAGAVPAPAGALGAAGVDVLARAERLAEPPTPAHAMRARLLLAAVGVLLAAGPVLTGLLAAYGVIRCGPPA